MTPKIRLLVVDPDIEFVGELADMLDQSNIDLVAADSLETVYARFRAVRPDVVVLDSGLGHETIVAMARLLKANAETRHIPIFLLADRRDIHRKMLIHGADGCFTKPFRIEAFISFIRKVSGPETVFTSYGFSPAP